MSTLNRSPFDAVQADLSNLLRYNGAKLIYSPDNVRSWHKRDVDLRM